MRFRHTQLANGLTIIGEERLSAVSSALGFFVRTGSRDEDAGIAGVSHFLEHMMFKGTATRSALDISYELGAIGAQANAFTSEENTVYYMAVLPEYFQTGVRLMSDMLRPALDPQEFDTEKQVIIEEIALYQDRPTHVLFEASMREFFGSHPAGNPVLGTIESVSGLTHQAMRRYFDARYAPSNLVLAAAGNFDWDEFISLARESCGSWQNHQVIRDYPGRRFEGGQKTLTKENLQCAHLVLVTPGPSAQSEKRYALQVLACILGDSSGSRVFWELIDKGLADAASVDVDEMDRTGFIYGYASAAPDRIEQVGDILGDILASPQFFSESDIYRAKTKLATRLVLQGESSMRRLMSVGLDWIYREAYQSLENEVKRIQAVSGADISEALNEFPLKPLTRVKLIPS